MNVAESPSAVGCSGCLAVPDAVERAKVKVQEGAREIQLTLPTIHCAACISAVERGLFALPGVHDVRVNLTRKRAVVHVSPEVEPTTLIAAAASLGYEAQLLDGTTLSAQESDHAARDLAMRLGVAGFSMMNVMLLSVAVWSGATDATRDLFHWLSAAIAIPTVAFSAQPFFTSALRALRVARLNMDVPISLAILLAIAMSLYETMSSGAHAYFDAALSLTFFLLAGRYLDQKMRSVARSAAAELAALEVPTALRMSNGMSETVRVQDVVVGDALLVQPGARIPVDGVVSAGTSEVDRAFLTGETDPVLVQSGDKLRAGEVNLSGALTMVAEAVGEDTLLHSLADLVSKAESSKSRYNSLADRAARIYAPLVHLLAFAAFLFWMLQTAGDIRHALNIAVAVLIITCPCALGLAVPAVSTVASGKLFKAGLLVKHPTALERLAEVDTVVFDKTGTLTLGAPELTNVAELSERDLSIAASLAVASAHPRSKAIVAAARSRNLALQEVADITEKPGFGIRGIWNGEPVQLGRASWLGANGDGTVFKIGDGQPVVFEYEDKLRSGAADLVRDLRTAGIPIMLLSGDSKDAVEKVANELGISEWRAGVLPDEKAEFLQTMEAAGKRSLMVGDGLNDTAALALAHVSIAPASALEASRVASDLVLVSPDLSHVADALRIGKSAKRRILENFSIAAMYNLVAVPVAFLGFATPLAAAIAMSTSSVIVSLNAMRTR